MQSAQPQASTPDKFLQFIVALANETRSKIKGSFANVQCVCGLAGPARAQGVGVLLIKGQQNLREIIADGEAGRRHIAAIPCISAEQAEALRQVMGEKDGRH